jgi:hypothetical protein
MSREVNQNRSLLLQNFVTAIGASRQPFIETGRKFDKVYVEGKVRYFVVRTDRVIKGVEVKEGDIFGAKSALAPNTRWYFGNLENVDKWEWSEFHGKPVNDPSVMPTKGYGRYVHYQKVAAQPA